jgi:hypothetical protein
MIRVRSHNNNTSSAPQTRRLMRREAGQLWRKKTLKLPRKEGTHRKIFLPKRYRVERSLPARPPGERSASVTGRVRPDSVTRREGKLCTPSKSAGGSGGQVEQGSTRNPLLCLCTVAASSMCPALRDAGASGGSVVCHVRGPGARSRTPFISTLSFCAKHVYFSNPTETICNLSVSVSNPLKKGQ